MPDNEKWSSGPSRDARTGSATGAGGDAGRQASEAARQAADAGRHVMDEARSRAAELGERAKDEGRDMLARQKDAAAGQVDSVVSAIRKTAGSLDDDNLNAGRYLEYAADRLDSLGRQLREKDVDTLIHDVQDLGRRSPGALFVGSLAAGFFLSRFLKSSGHRSPDEYAGSSHGTAGETRSAVASTTPAAGFGGTASSGPTAGTPSTSGAAPIGAATSTRTSTPGDPHGIR